MSTTHRPHSADESRKIAEQSGLEIVDGAFVRYCGIGEFVDVGTGLVFKGCRAEVDPVTRQVVALIDPAPPTQLPTHRWTAYDSLVDFEKRNVSKDSVRVIDGREMCMVPFSTKTLDEKTLGLVLALRTGTLSYASADEMSQLWPEQWKVRQNEIVHDTPKRPSEDLADMFDKLMNTRRVSLETEAAKRK